MALPTAARRLETHEPARQRRKTANDTYSAEIGRIGLNWKLN